MPRKPLTLAVLNDQRGALGLPPYTGADEPAELRRAALDTVLAGIEAGGAEPSRPVVMGAVRFLLDRLAELAPGRSVEVRVPPYAAVQCIDGPHHTRGTPPNVVEMDAAAWIGLATGRLAWDDAIADGRARASGARADLSEHLPLPIDQPAAGEVTEPG
ncbi:sterol carrier family protein [Actinomadura sp. 9N215]|uniref:sterol carrier family protein n=1 Tax=Actinomadura sp. 9N215 TaxID=3375150 RepID=UPI0037A30630